MGFNREELKLIASNSTWYRVRGWAMLLVGACLVVLNMLKHDVDIGDEFFSWLPFAGIVLLLVGFSQWLLAVGKQSSLAFIINFQISVLDIVVGALIIFAIGSDTNRLSLLISGYLIIQGIMNTVLLYMIDIKTPLSAWIGGWISIILGLIIILDWLSSPGWFLAICLNTEIALRGWSLLIFGKIYKKYQIDTE